jgi:mitochondrial protein import protein ZIM17
VRSFTKNAYETGVVLMRCENCQNIHLIADNLGWFEDDKWNVEKNLNAKKVGAEEVAEALKDFMKGK